MLGLYLTFSFPARNYGLAHSGFQLVMCMENLDVYTHVYNQLLFYFIVTGMNIHQVLVLPFCLFLLVQVSALHAALPANQSSHDTVESPHESSRASMCAGNICRVKNDTMQYLQNTIQSDQKIMFDRKTFHVSVSSLTGEGFIRLENVSNVLISGHAGDNHIECSSGTRFGLYFKNVTNVTVTGLTISNCGALIPQYLKHELLHSPDLPIVCPPHFTDVTTGQNCYCSYSCTSHLTCMCTYIMYM